MPKVAQWDSFCYSTIRGGNWYVMEQSSLSTPPGIPTSSDKKNPTTLSTIANMMMTFRKADGSMKTTMGGVRIIISFLFFYFSIIMRSFLRESVRIITHHVQHLCMCFVYTTNKKKSKTVVKPPHLALLLKKPIVTMCSRKPLAFTYFY